MFIELMFSSLMEIGDRRTYAQDLLLELVHIFASTVIESLCLEIACRLLRISVSIVRLRPPSGAHRVGGQERSRFRRDVHPARDKGNHREEASRGLNIHVQTILLDLLLYFLSIHLL
jgi:hypothetical protein